LKQSIFACPCPMQLCGLFGQELVWARRCN
jgi:hypothetical protein